MICERCGTVFCWDDADVATLAGNRKRYCSTECKTRGRGKGDVVAQSARRRRRRQRDERKWRNCLNRAKNPYESQGEATADAARVWSESGVALYSYECVCGWWHLSREPEARTLPARNEPDSSPEH